MRLGRVLGPALLVAAGLELLKSGGRLYVQRTESNPAYQVVAGAVGLLVFLNLLNQLILFAAALSATSTHGPVTDLAAGPRAAGPHTTETAGANSHPHRIIRRSPIRKASGARGARPRCGPGWRRVRVTSVTRVPSAIGTVTSPVVQPDPGDDELTLADAFTELRRRKPSA
jgi:hypothetical protein